MSEFDGLPEELRSALAHELRTPLSIIVGYAEILEQRADEKTRLDAARTIKEAAERMSATLDGMLRQGDR